MTKRERQLAEYVAEYVAEYEAELSKVDDEIALSEEELSEGECFSRLVGQVQKMTRHIENPHFIASQWVAEWLAEPMPALGGRKPCEFMNTVEGRQMVEGLIERSLGGSFS